MIREVEISNTTEYLEDGLQISNFEDNPDLITAILSDNGATMTVKINRLLKTDYHRKVTLVYMLPKYEQQIITEYTLATFGPDDTVDETEEYIFDLSTVISTIIHTSPEQIADDTITIRLYTYEANISTDYGIKTLHVPYTVSYPSTMIVPASTDGWYCLRIIDIGDWIVDTQYYIGDPVWYVDGMYTCIADSLGDIPTDTTHWAVLTEEEERNLYEFGLEDSPAVASLINSNMLITRYIKQKYIYELLLKTNFKRYDNIAVVTELEKLYAMREAAIVHLMSGDPIMARHMLDLITIESNSFTTNNGERKIVEVITNFTI